jgi:hypothetical protein
MDIVENALKPRDAICATLRQASQKVRSLLIKARYQRPNVISFPTDRIEVSPASLAGNT